MKKIFALALAALMTAGMTTVAFAADAFPVFVNNGGPSAKNDVYVDVNDDGKFELGEIKDTFEYKGTISLDEIPGDKKVAIPLYLSETGDMITDKDDVKGYKVKSTWSVGDLDEKAAIELVKIAGEYRYAVTFTLPESALTKYSDLAGDISVYKSSSDLKDSNTAYDNITVHFGAEYGYNQDYLEEVEDIMDEAEIVIFKDKDAPHDGLEGEYTLNFGDLMEFEVDVTGQGKLNLKNNVDFNKEFAAMYDYANIDFITFEKEPTFNKNGTAYIYADEDAYIYEVTADGAKEIKGLKWDEDYEAWTFKTRTLKAYAISDVELDEKTVTEDKDDASSTTDGGKTNPDTGR